MARRVFVAVIALQAAACAAGSDGDVGVDRGAPSAPVDHVTVPSDPEAPPPARHEGSASSVDLGTSWRASAGASTPLGFVCRKDAFCDDFEDATPGSRWTRQVATDATLAFVGPSSTLGARAVRAATLAGGAPSYLELAGKPLGSHWSGALGVSIRLEGAATNAIGGPEIVVRGADGAPLGSVTLVVRPEGIALEQRDAGCHASACSVRSDLVASAVAGEWRRIVVGLEANDVPVAPFGRVEVSVDGGDNGILPLVVRPLAGQIFVNAGITEADVSASALRVDDVMFFTR